MTTSDTDEALILFTGHVSTVQLLIHTVELLIVLLQILQVLKLIVAMDALCISMFLSPTAISHNVKENVLIWNHFFPSNGVELLQGTWVKWSNVVSTPNDLNIVVRLRSVLMETSTSDCITLTL